MFWAHWTFVQNLHSVYLEFKFSCCLASYLATQAVSSKLSNRAEIAIAAQILLRYAFRGERFCSRLGTDKTELLGFGCEVSSQKNVLLMAWFLLPCMQKWGLGKWLNHEDSNFSNGQLHWWVQILMTLLGGVQNFYRLGLAGGSRSLGTCPWGHVLYPTTSSLSSVHHEVWYFDHSMLLTRILCLTMHDPEAIQQRDHTLKPLKPGAKQTFRLFAIYDRPHNLIFVLSKILCVCLVLKETSSNSPGGDISLLVPSM